MTPIVDGLEQTYRGRLVFKRVNANEGDGPAIMRDYRIPGHPTTLIFDSEGREVQRFIGPQPAEAIEDVILTVVNE
ncbi:MAG: thioredoxin family protein [Anaerolineae bacterium]|nr:thioredoxin family protein [Anaerolineae bacterium]